MTIGSNAGPVYAGIDLAADPARTGIAVISEHPDQQRLVIEEARLGADDAALVDLVIGAGKTGVDVPLGWPQTFVEHVLAHSTGRLTGLTTTDIAWRRSMAMRCTDLLVAERFGLRPLSVATDRIAYPALRWWGLPHRGYKSPTAQVLRQQIVEGLDGVFPELEWNGFREECLVSDDVLDAVIAALVARETAAQRTWAPAAAERELALSEGWIHVPMQ